MRNRPVAVMPCPWGGSEKGHPQCQGPGPTAIHLPPRPPVCPDPCPLPAPIQDWVSCLAGPTVLGPAFSPVQSHLLQGTRICRLQEADHSCEAQSVSLGQGR